MRKRCFKLFMAAAAAAAAGLLCPVGAYGTKGALCAEASGPEILGAMVQAIPKAELKLTAVPDYSAMNGVGAVKLRWEQRDGTAKAYGIYRREEGQAEFEQIFFGADEEKEVFRELAWEYEGQVRSVVIPAAGFYSLAAQGAQGGNHGTFAGGLGGKVQATFYLEKGERLLVTVGGQNGFGGGGRATEFGSGGGCTVISSDRKGILLAAGGGGGATSSCCGLQGGADVTYSAHGIDSGQEGMAGGGGGSVGGRAGIRIPHVHSPEGGCYRDGSYDAVSSGYTAAPIERQWWDEERDWEDDGYIRSDFYFSSQAGGSGNLIPTRGNTVLELGAWVYGEGINWIGEKTYIQVTDQNGKPLLTSTIGKLRQEWNAFETSVVLPAGGGIYRGWPPIANVYLHTNWSQSNPDSDEYDILDGYEVSYPIFYENGTARAARVYLNSRYGNPIFAGNYAGEYYPPEDIWLSGSGILARRGYGDRPLLFCERSKWYGMSGVHFLHQVSIPEGTTGICIYAEGMLDSLQYHEGERIKKPVKWCTVRFDQIRLWGSMELDCGAKDVDIPAEGGSSYVNRKYALSWQASEGIRKGDGNAWLKADRIGLTEAAGMDAADARDKAAPYGVDTDSIRVSGAGDHVALVEFAAVEDRGTRYLFRAESYSVLTGEKLCDSNIAECLVKTGVKGYLFLVDSHDDTELPADADRGAWQMVSAEDRRVRVRIGQEVQYLHIAAVDGAGNGSDTVHVKLDPDSIGIAWEISTEEIEVSSVVGGKDHGSVHPAQGEDSYYVKADGSTPFLLSFRSHMHGPARADYQITHQIFDLRTEGQAQKHGMQLPCSQNPKLEEALDAARFSLWTEGDTILTGTPYRGAVRSQGAKVLNCWHGFTMPASQSGRAVVVVPVAGAAYEDYVKFSDWNNDTGHSVTLIADGEGPMITGLEKMADWELIDRKHDSIGLEVFAEDALSGVREFYLEIKNQDNFLEKRIFPDEDGRIKICITDEEPIFSGIFTVEAFAEDNVGNRTVIGGEITEFALSAGVSRILPPHEPIFKRGESGILCLEAWGYAEKVEVEFPEFLSAYNRTFLYEASPRHKEAEEIQFMVPLGAPEGIFEITVRAYKGDKKLEAHPAISTLEVNGSVLDELRTRLR